MLGVIGVVKNMILLLIIVKIMQKLFIIVFEDCILLFVIIKYDICV